MRGESQFPLLEVRDLKVSYAGRHGNPDMHAVKGVSLTVGKGEMVGLVGESGCGKTTLGNAVAGLIHPASGGVYFQGVQVNAGTRGWMRQYRRMVQMVFQDPMGALNPRMPVGAAIEETLYVHRAQLGLGVAAARRGRMFHLLDQAGLGCEVAMRYPHEISGGQRQRVGIARALAVNPHLLIADEPVSALDVSVQAQILNLLKDISEKLSVACLFIAHDLAVVRYMCRRTYVMYKGMVVEEGVTDDLFSYPAHAYTRALIAAVPDLGKTEGRGREDGVSTA